ncbi:cyanophycinase [Clostridium sp.]|uniref:cyanophycinase n=1 Tax=Clostridium sp. TaxID=1506 RepID=UPI003D6D1EF0
MEKKCISFILSFMLMFSTFSVALANTNTSTEDIKGSLVIVGGGLGSSNSQIYNKFIDLAGGAENAKIGIIGAASSKPVFYSNQFKNELISYGVKAENIEIIPIAVKDDKTTKDVDETKWDINGNNEDLAAKVKGLSGIWFVGGDQTRIMSTLKNKDGSNTKVLDSIWEIYKKGAVIGGTSAGAAIMSSTMIVGGNSLSALNKGIIDEDTGNDDDGVYLTEGLGFFRYGIVDQHFDMRARIGRLISSAYTKGDKNSFAYGVDENTAMIVNNSTKTLEVVGKSGLTVLDYSKMTMDKVNGKPSIKNVSINYITPGDKLNLLTKEILPDEKKDATNGYEYYNFKAPINTGVLTSYAQIKNLLGYNLVDNAGTSSVKSYSFDEKGDGYEITFTKNKNTMGYWNYVDGNIDQYSALNVSMDIVPVVVNIKADKATTEKWQAKTILPATDSMDIKGSIMAIGGALGSSNADVYNKFIELSGGKENARIGIIPAASGNLKSSKAFKEDLVKYGVKAENVEIIPLAIKNDKNTPADESKWIENANKTEIVDEIKGYTGIWFVGGDQTRITKVLLNADGSNSKALDAMWDIYKNGAVLGGTSAGAAIMSDMMIGGGDSLGALNDGFTDTYSDSDQQEYGPLYIDKGLGFFKFGMIDQHFDKKARLGRLVKAAFEKEDKYNMAFGIDENTALVFHNKSKSLEVIGKGGITVVDLSKSLKDASAKRSTFKDVVISYIVKGDSFNLSTKEFTINDNKDLTNDYEYGDYDVPVNSGVFTSHSPIKNFITYDLVDNTANSTKSYSFDESGRGFEIVFRKTLDTKGYWQYSDGNIDDYSALNIYMDINPINSEIVYVKSSSDDNKVISEPKVETMQKTENSVTPLPKTGSVLDMFAIMSIGTLIFSIGGYILIKKKRVKN